MGRVSRTNTSSSGAARQNFFSQRKQRLNNDNCCSTGRPRTENHSRGCEEATFSDKVFAIVNNQQNPREQCARSFLHGYTSSINNQSTGYPKQKKKKLTITQYQHCNRSPLIGSLHLGCSIVQTDGGSHGTIQDMLIPALLQKTAKRPDPTPSLVEPCVCDSVVFREKESDDQNSRRSRTKLLGFFEQLRAIFYLFQKA